MWLTLHHCTDPAPARSPFLTFLGGELGGGGGGGPDCFMFRVAFIDGHNIEN